MVENGQSAPLALVTGASSGIGREIARQLAPEGYDLVLIARRTELLESLSEELVSNHQVTTHVLTLDLCSRGAVDRIIEFLDESQLEVHTLVNNAGFGLIGRFHEGDRQELLDMVQLNMNVLADLTRCLTPGMVERGDGRILNIGSSASFQPAPLGGLYHATKAFVLFLTEALAEELRGTGVTATALCPGPVGQTEFGARQGANNKIPGFDIVRVGVKRVVKAGLDGSRRGKTIVVPGFTMRLSSMITPRLPRWFTRKVIHRVMRSRV